MKVCGLVAAAGRSSRMGTCKALLAIDGTTFVARCARALLDGGCAPVVVTVPDDDAQRAAVVAALRGLDVVVARNERPEDGLTGSIAATPDTDAVVVAPVDAPFFDAADVRALVEAVVKAPAAVLVVDGARGHPVALSRSARALLGDGGPRRVLDALGDAVVTIVARDHRAADDVDTPGDYARLTTNRAAT